MYELYLASLLLGVNFFDVRLICFTGSVDGFASKTAIASATTTKHLCTITEKHNGELNTRCFLMSWLSIASERWGMQKATSRIGVGVLTSSDYPAASAQTHHAHLCSSETSGRASCTYRLENAACWYHIRREARCRAYEGLLSTITTC
jgi:hypothetical protein